jgi:hypothetical protein
MTLTTLTVMAQLSDPSARLDLSLAHLSNLAMLAIAIISQIIGRQVLWGTPGLVPLPESVLRFTQQNPDFILLHALLDNHLADAFRHFDKSRSTSSKTRTAFKHRLLQRYRDLLYTQLLFPTHMRTEEVGLMEKVREKLDGSPQGVNVPRLIARLQAIRAKYIAKRRDPRSR